MSAFYVGQRVRLVRPTRGEYGQTGTIVDFLCVPAGTLTRDFIETSIDCDCLVYWDDYSDGIPACQHTSQLEPIVDDGRKVVSWSDCLWQPEGIAA